MYCNCNGKQVEKVKIIEMWYDLHFERITLTALWSLVVGGWVQKQGACLGGDSSTQTKHHGGLDKGSRKEGGAKGTDWGSMLKMGKTGLILQFMWEERENEESRLMYGFFGLSNSVFYIYWDREIRGITDLSEKLWVLIGIH